MYGYIYKITNIKNNHIYIGYTTRTIEKRFDEHLKSTDTIGLHGAIKNMGLKCLL